MKISKEQNKKLKLIGSCILGVYVLLTMFFGFLMANARDKAAEEHKKRMDATQVEVKYPEKKDHFTEVKVGSYIENIHDLSIADTTFSADLYIWFS